MRFFLIALPVLLAGHCYFDPNPPAEDRLYDDRPVLVLKLSGFTSSAPLYIRYTDKDGVFVANGSRQLYTDINGNAFISLNMTHDTTSADLLLFVDNDKDGDIDTADYGTLQTGIAFADNHTEKNLTITHAAGSLNAYSTAVSAPAQGQKVCVYSFENHPFRTDSIPEYRSAAAKVATLREWRPFSTVDTGSTTTAAALPSGTYSETCIADTDSDSEYDSGETTEKNTITVP